MIIYHDRASTVPTSLLTQIQSVIRQARPVGGKQPMFLTGGFEGWKAFICNKIEINKNNHIEIGDGFGISNIKLDVRSSNVFHLYLTRILISRFH